MSNAQDINLTAVGGNFPYGGTANTFSGANYDTNTFSNNLETQYTGGFIGSFNAVVVSNSGDGMVPQDYTGFAINYGTVIATGFPATNSAMYDNQPPLTWAKDQQIYYKLTGFNPNTLTFETWVIAEEVVPRPETFDPSGNFPNIDYGVYFTPPSGNSLVNIRILGRWIQ